MLTKEDIHRIISKSNYWKEISQRDDGSIIAQQEFREEFIKFGAIGMLLILEDYARILNKQGA